MNKQERKWNLEWMCVRSSITPQRQIGDCWKHPTRASAPNKEKREQWKYRKTQNNSMPIP